MSELTDNNIDPIDLTRLEEEWVEQPGLYLSYADEVAEARKAHAIAKQEAEEIEAEVKNEARLHPDRFGIEKITEDRVKSAALLSSRVKLANRRMIEAKYRQDRAENRMWACDQRKKALEKEVDLWMAGYFSTPKVKGDRRPMEEAEKQASRRAGRQEYD